MTLWQPFHRVPGISSVTSHLAYVDMTNHVDFADLGNITFTAEYWFYLPIIDAETLLNKGDALSHCYQNYAGTWLACVIGWVAGFWYSGSYGGITHYNPTFSCAGKWYDTVHGNWWHIVRSENSGNLPGAYFTGAWHHYSAMWVRADLNHIPDIYIHIDGKLFTLTGYPPPIYQGNTEHSDAVINLQGDINTVNPITSFHPMKLGWLRLSNIARYPCNTDPFLTQEFTPTPRLTPPTPDGNTLGLWYFNEGSGIISYDQTGDTSKDATIYDGIWDGNVLTLNI